MFPIFSIKLRPTKLSVRAVKNVLEIIRQLAIITIGDSRLYQAKCCIQPNPTTTTTNQRELGKKTKCSNQSVLCLV